jgi:DNA invertase Pin-like site-specific DNA recombinase
VQFRSLSEHLDTTTPTGKLTFHVIGALAEFERGLRCRGADAFSSPGSTTSA